MRPELPKSGLVGVLVVGFVVQATLGLVGHVQAADLDAAVGLAARYSGRFSFLVYLSVVVALIRWRMDASRWSVAFLLSVGFAWVHLLHFGFLMSNLVLNGIEPEVPKAIGGALAYALIVAHPFLMLRRQPHHAWHVVYVYYVGLVMGLTFLARYRGEFPGAEPENIHLLGMSMVAVAFLTYTFYRFLRAPGLRGA